MEYEFRLRKQYRGWVDLPPVLRFSFDERRGITGQDGRYMRMLLRPGDWVMFGPHPGWLYRLSRRPYRNARDIAIVFGVHYELPSPFAELWEEEVEQRRRIDEQRRQRLGSQLVY